MVGGGEGAIYEVTTSADLVAKIYHSILPDERANKIRVMIPLRNDRISKLVAWPLDLLATAGSRAPIGLLIPKIPGGKDIHRLYSPKSRIADFPHADWRFLIRASANTARAFAVVHEDRAGCIIGDVNHGSVLVSQDATVRLIDCDSFQLIAAGRRFLCEVGVETFTPPELQERSFRGVVRNQNHDNFGLAVLIFLMLFMGRHPFAGKFLGGPDQIQIPRAIKECRFAYGARRATVQMERPPGTPPLSIVGDEVGFMFERAFAKEMTGGGRPTPRDWFESLERLEKSLKRCSANPSHWHRNDTPCPWCPIEGATGVILFPSITGFTKSTINLDALWHQIEALRLAWRTSVENQFHFDRGKAIDPRETARVEREVLLERRKLEGLLKTGFAELKQIHAQILAARQHMMPQVVVAQSAYLQAEADFKAARGAR